MNRDLFLYYTYRRNKWIERQRQRLQENENRRRRAVPMWSTTLPYGQRRTVHREYSPPSTESAIALKNTRQKRDRLEKERSSDMIGAANPSHSISATTDSEDDLSDLPIYDCTDGHTYRNVPALVKKVIENVLKTIRSDVKRKPSSWDASRKKIQTRDIPQDSAASETELSQECTSLEDETLLVCGDTRFPKINEDAPTDTELALGGTSLKDETRLVCGDTRFSKINEDAPTDTELSLGGTSLKDETRLVCGDTRFSKINEDAPTDTELSLGGTSLKDKVRLFSGDTHQPNIQEDAPLNTELSSRGTGLKDKARLIGGDSHVPKIIEDTPSEIELPHTGTGLKDKARLVCDDIRHPKITDDAPSETELYPTGTGLRDKARLFSGDTHHPNTQEDKPFTTELSRGKTGLKDKVRLISDDIYSPKIDETELPPTGTCLKDKARLFNGDIRHPKIKLEAPSDTELLLTGTSLKDKARLVCGDIRHPKIKEDASSDTELSLAGTGLKDKARLFSGDTHHPNTQEDAPLITELSRGKTGLKDKARLISGDIYPPKIKEDASSDTELSSVGNSMKDKQRLVCGDTSPATTNEDIIDDLPSHYASSVSLSESSGSYQESLGQLLECMSSHNGSSLSLLESSDSYQSLGQLVDFNREFVDENEIVKWNLVAEKARRRELKHVPLCDILFSNPSGERDTEPDRKVSTAEVSGCDTQPSSNTEEHERGRDVDVKAVDSFAGIQDCRLVKQYRETVESENGYLEMFNRLTFFTPFACLDQHDQLSFTDSDSYFDADLQESEVGCATVTATAEDHFTTASEYSDADFEASNSELNDHFETAIVDRSECVDVSVARIVGKFELSKRYRGLICEAEVNDKTERFEVAVEVSDSEEADNAVGDRERFETALEESQPVHGPLLSTLDDDSKTILMPIALDVHGTRTAVLPEDMATHSDSDSAIGGKTAGDSIYLNTESFSAPESYGRESDATEDSFETTMDSDMETQESEARAAVARAEARTHQRQNGNTLMKERYSPTKANSVPSALSTASSSHLPRAAESLTLPFCRPQRNGPSEHTCQKDILDFRNSGDHCDITDGYHVINDVAVDARINISTAAYRRRRRNARAATNRYNNPFCDTLFLAFFFTYLVVVCAALVFFKSMYDQLHNSVYPDQCCPTWRGEHKMLDMYMELCFTPFERCRVAIL